jgi:uncharacterized protein YjbI with pentapeptide repeats
MITAKFIGNKITSARKKAALSQSALAQKITISPQAVGKWERGESMPDILVLNRLAEILGVDLNYFSEKFSSIEMSALSLGNVDLDIEVNDVPTKNKKNNWNMSDSNWKNVDFSGIKNIHENFSSANLESCMFHGAELTSLQLRNNIFQSCDFAGSKFNGSVFHKSNLLKSKFSDCSFKECEFFHVNFAACDFSNADFSKVIFENTAIEKCFLNESVLNRTSFVNCELSGIVFEGLMERCSFEKCSFSKVTFQKVKLISTFFKYSDLKRIKFIDCEADRLTYELLRHGKADLSQIKIIKE